MDSETNSLEGVEREREGEGGDELCICFHVAIMDRPLLTIYYVVSLNHNANEMTLVIPRGAARWAVRQACCGASGRRPGPPCFYFTSVNGGGRSWRHAAAGSSSGLLAQLPSMEQLGLWEDDHGELVLRGASLSLAINGVAILNPAVHVAMSGGVDSSVVLRILAEMVRVWRGDV